MSFRFIMLFVLSIAIMLFMLGGCFQPPFNHFKHDITPIGPSEFIPYFKKRALIHQLEKQGIQFISYGNIYTLIVPTDRYFVFNTPQLNDICYRGLNYLAKFIKTFEFDTVYVAAFTDEVGTKQHQDHLSKAQSETMLTFLWANHIPAERLKAEGYGKAHPIGDNQFIHSSAYNRRIEIQWTSKNKCCEGAIAHQSSSMMK